jgi:hypothetical protein
MAPGLSRALRTLLSWVGLRRGSLIVPTIAVPALWLFLGGLGKHPHPLAMLVLLNVGSNCSDRQATLNSLGKPTESKIL